MTSRHTRTCAHSESHIGHRNCIVSPAECPYDIFLASCHKRISSLGQAGKGGGRQNNMATKYQLIVCPGKVEVKFKNRRKTINDFQH